MFRDACTDARNYTIPVVISHRLVNGKCGAGLGAAIVLNDEGWFITAAHIAAELAKLMAAVEKTTDRRTEAAKIRDDATLNSKQKGKKLRALGKEKPQDITNYGVIWGGNGGTVKTLQAPPQVDIAIGKLDGADLSGIKKYPVFRSGYSEDIGVSVCRYGYPLHSVKPDFDDAKTQFTYPNGLFPIPMFANEGIVSRYVNFVVPGEKPPLPYERRLFETSSPGLRGQSGGPIFDVDGRIWGIQSETKHYELGFAPEVSGHKEHQFLNVGWAVDAHTVCSFLDAQGVKYQTA